MYSVGEKFKRTLLLWFIGMQFTIIVALTVHLFHKLRERQILGVAVVRQTKSVDSGNQDIFTYGELDTNTIYTDKVSWLPKPAIHITNADGLSGNVDYAIPKPTGIFRIIILGDSETYGLWVNTEDSFPARLADFLNQRLHCTNISKFEVLNFGVPSYDIEYSAKRFERKGDKYEPDLIIWYIIDNDFTDYHKIQVLKGLQYQKELVDRGIDLKKYYEAQADSLTMSPDNPWYRADKDMESEYTLEWIRDHQRDVLDKFVLDSQYSIVLLSRQERMRGQFKDLLRSTVTLRSNLWYAELPHYDLLPDTHPSVQGHETIANFLYNYLVRQKIISCKQG